MSTAVFAVDLGGTNLRLAVVDPEGKILAHARTPSSQISGPEALLDSLGALADECRISVKTNHYFTNFCVTELNYTILRSLDIILKFAKNSQGRYRWNHVKVGAFPSFRGSISASWFIKIDR